MASVVKGMVKLIVPAVTAKPGPKIGQALGPLGVNMADFVKRWNAETEAKGFKPGVELPCKLTAFGDRSYVYTVATPQTTWFLKKAAGIEKGAHNPGHEHVGELSLRHIYHIAEIKKWDGNLKNLSLEQVTRMIVHQCKSVGIKVTK